MYRIEENLLADEQIRFKARIQQVIFVLPVVLILVGLVLFILTSSNPVNLPAFIFPVSVALFLLGSTLFLWAAFVYTTTELVLTNHRLLARSGWPRGNSMEIAIQKVESVLIHQSWMGRIFNYGTIIVVGGGGTIRSVQNIAAPVEFRKKVEGEKRAD